MFLVLLDDEGFEAGKMTLIKVFEALLNAF